MLKRLKMTNVGPAATMDLELASRLNLLTGDNGLGKSFLLDAVWWALTRRWPRDVNPKLTSGYMARPRDIKKAASIEFTLEAKVKEVPYASTWSPRDEAWTGKAGRPWNPGLVLYAHADGSFSVWDPARNYWRKKGNVDVQERLPAYVFSPQEVWDGLEIALDGGEVTVCNGLVRDWASWIDKGGVDAKNMATVLKLLSPSPSPHDLLQPGPLVRISLNDAREIPSLKTSTADAVPILHASSGIRRVIALAYMLLWSWREHRAAAALLGEEPTHQVVMLIDEVESHLHPRWQRTILSSVLKLAGVLHKKASTQLIAATHSPLVLASVEPFFNPDCDAWFDLDLEPANGGVAVNLRRRIFTPHGTVGNWLTSEAFDLRTERGSVEAENAILEARALLKRPDATLEEIMTVHARLRAVLPDLDAFWVRWSAFVERQGGQP